MTTDTNTEQVDEKIVVNEAADGSAIVALPESIKLPDQDGSEEDDAAAQRAEIAATGSIDPDREAEREARRAKRKARKEYHRQVSNEKDVKLNLLERQNRELLERLAVVEKKTLATDLARMDNKIAEEEHRINFAKEKIKEAAETGNGELMVSAQDLLVESSKTLESLKVMRQRAAKPQRPQTAAPAVDPDVQRQAADWLARNSWYDPQGRDADSRRVLNEDVILSDEGYDPRTPEYWQELDNRLSRMMPHRYTGGVGSENTQTSRPRTVVTGSGRQTSSGASSPNQFQLSREQVQAMKDAGMWDDPVARNRMIKRYASETSKY